MVGDKDMFTLAVVLCHPSVLQEAAHLCVGPSERWKGHWIPESAKLRNRLCRTVFELQAEALQ